jgi:hypothetical protein
MKFCEILILWKISYFAESKFHEIKFQYRTERISEGCYSVGAITLCPLFTVHCPLCTVHCALSTVHCSLPIVKCTLSTACPPLPIAHCLLPSSHCLLSTSYCPLLTVHGSLFNFHCHCPLPTAHCPLLTAHCIYMLYICSIFGSISFLKATVCRNYLRFALSGHRFCECSGQWPVIVCSGQQAERSKRWAVNSV